MGTTVHNFSRELKRVVLSDSRFLQSFFQSRAVSGIRCSFRLHRLIKKDRIVLRGIRACDLSPFMNGINIRDLFCLIHYKSSFSDRFQYFLLYIKDAFIGDLLYLVVYFTASPNNCKMVNGVPKMTNDGQAILSGLYQSLRVNRQQRRSFLSAVLRLFSEDCREVNLNIFFRIASSRMEVIFGI